MTRNPYYNALAAAAYIVGIVLLISAMAKPNTPDTIFIPMMMLSLLTLSVASMAYIFFYQPLMLYLEGKRQEAVGLFTKTLLAFAILTGILVFLNFAV